MRQWTQVIGRGRSALEVTDTVKEPPARTPEERALWLAALRLCLGEPTPEMFEKKPKARHAGGQKGGQK